MSILSKLSAPYIKYTDISNTAKKIIIYGDTWKKETIMNLKSDHVIYNGDSIEVEFSDVIKLIERLFKSKKCGPLVIHSEPTYFDTSEWLYNLQAIAVVRQWHKSRFELVTMMYDTSIQELKKPYGLTYGVRLDNPMRGFLISGLISGYIDLGKFISDAEKYTVEYKENISTHTKKYQLVPFLAYALTTLQASGKGSLEDYMTSMIVSISVKL